VTSVMICLSSLVLLFVFFFFQAEDGIRDGHVTGVQTCALPICPGVPSVLPPLPAGLPNNRLGLAKWLVDPSNTLTARVTVNRIRSEERRVGKECRARWWQAD